jgi:hypothetical protein
MTRALSGILLLMVMTAIMLAAGPAHAFDWDGFDHLRASDVDLDQQRGGWINRSGVELSFGLEQLTVVDGEVLHHRVAGIPCAGCGIDEIQGGFLLRNDGSGTMLQEFEASGLISILQNSLDNVHIGQLTVLNIGFTGAGALGDMPLLRLIEAGMLNGLPSF